MNLRDKLLSRLPKTDLRMDAAVRHVDAFRTFPIAEIKEKLAAVDIHDRMLHDFLAGWDAAMEVRFAELLDENTELHARIVELEIEKLNSSVIVPPFARRE